MPFNVGPLELIIVLVIALLVVGPRRLPEMGEAVGKTIREFRKASSDLSESTAPTPAAPAAPAADAASAATPPTPEAKAPSTEQAPAAAPAGAHSDDD
jgi:sec-independent protein translocase protein TatA